MKASYCIYFNEKPYLILNVAEDRFSTLKNQDGTLVLLRPENAAIADSIRQLDNNEVNAVMVFANNANKALDTFSSHFTMIQAGGGMVANEKAEYLFIFRRGKWDLPKGKLDEGETIADCALREVMEETGLKQVNMGDHLCNTYHVYHEKGKFILKESVWYQMQCDSKQALTPQTEEDIMEIKWLAPEAWGSIMNDTFPSIKEVLKASGKLKLGN